MVPSVLWHCWLGGRKGIRTVKKLSGGVLRGYLSWAMCRFAMAQMMTLPLTVSCSSKIQVGFTFLAPAHLGSPGQRPLKGGVTRRLKRDQLWNTTLCNRGWATFFTNIPNALRLVYDRWTPSHITTVVTSNQWVVGNTYKGGTHQALLYTICSNKYLVVNSSVTWNVTYPKSWMSAWYFLSRTVLQFAISEYK